MVFNSNTSTYPALIQAVFHVGDPSWARENRRPKIKFFFFFGKFYSLKAHAHCLAVFIYLATWRTAKLSIFTSFTFTILPRYSLSVNSLINAYSIQIFCYFLCVLQLLPKNIFCINPCVCSSIVNIRVNIRCSHVTYCMGIKLFPIYILKAASQSKKTLGLNVYYVSNIALYLNGFTQRGEQSHF